MEQHQSHFLCFKCSKTFLTSRNLMDHFKYNHPYLSAYVCKQENCFRSFRDIIGFRKHLLSKHLIGVINTEDKSKKAWNVLFPKTHRLKMNYYITR